MMQHLKSYLSLFLITLCLTLGIQSNNSSLGKPAIAINQPSANSEILVSKKSRSSSTRKSGGRSSGGSFKTRSKTKTKKSPSSSGSRSSSTSKKKSSGNTKKITKPATPTYRDRSRNRDYYEPKPYYPKPSYPGTRGRTYNSYGKARPVNPILKLLGWLILALLIFIPLFIFCKFLTRYFNRDNREQRKIAQEVDNDTVTVSLIQVALSATRATAIQTELNELALSADTKTPEGLLSLMRDASLILTRNFEAWTHVLAHSESTNISKAESLFESLSLKQRNKFSGESLSNVNGALKSREIISYQEDFADYLVVTLIFGTADDQPLFGKITNEQELEKVLLKLAAMDEAYLFKFELLWTPQAEGIYLSDEELLLQYSDMLPLI